MITILARKPHGRASRSQLKLPVVALLCAARSTALHGQTHAVEFTAEVPAAPAQMQIYKLEATSAPLEFLNEKLTAIKLPALKLEQEHYLTRSATGKDDHDRVRAFVHSANGDAHLIPNLAELAPAAKPAASVSPDLVRRVSRTALSDVRFIPKDATELRFAEPITVTGNASSTVGAATGNAAALKQTEPKTVLTIAPAIRYASGLRVYGLGSHAAVSIANDGAMVGALRRWRTASLGDRIAPSITADRVRADIERQLAPQIAADGTHAKVDKIELAYYDANAGFLQPVYHFLATITPGDKNVSGIRVTGYVPIGKLYEPIPDLAARAENGPAAATREMRLAPRVAEATGGVGNAVVTLGEYANQDWHNNGAYVDMSNRFYAGLEAGNAVPPTKPKIVRTQWYVAYPWEVVGPSSKNFLNAVNIAYTVPHGNWLYNTTLSNYGDGWHVTDIGTHGNPGFGHAAGGVLATWVIMSCEVVPSMYDRQNEEGGTGNPQTAFNAWWPVFQGLHNVIGFRTEMLYPDDNLQYGFGRAAALGGDVNAAWFQEVAANDPDDGTYNDDHLKGHPLVHYDRASTIIDARNLGQSIYNIAPQSKSTTLWNFWMSN